MVLLSLACALDLQPKAGAEDSTKPEVDQDADGFTADVDCDDAAVSVHPGAQERCDGRDDDCDGVVPAGEIDGDGDGHAACAGDCDDATVARAPGVVEDCDGLDNDCDGVLPDEEADLDGDGFGACAGDCDDTAPDTFPGAPDTCDGVDTDCGGEVEDADGDGWFACGSDCDDARADVNPAQVEVCNGRDDDCDGETPKEEVDCDGDGVSASEGDCDDEDPAISTLSVEECDGIDNDCDGAIDADCVSCNAAVPNDHATIQLAIDAAVDGDVVCVGPGKWEEAIDFGGTNLKLLGAKGPDETSLKGTSQPIVRFESGETSSAVLQGFTIRDAYSSDPGAGIRVVGASPTLTDLWIEDNTTSTWDQAGAGVYVEDGSPAIVNVTFRGNSACLPYCGACYGSGAGVYLSNSDATFENVTFEDNRAGSFGGAVYAAQSNAVFTNVTFLGNESTAGGGAVYLSGSDPSFENVLVYQNANDSYWSDGSGGALYLADSSPTFTNAIFYGNTADRSGGFAHVSSGSPEFSDTVVYANDPDDFDAFPVGTDGNLEVDPLFEPDGLHLSAVSPLIDAGEPSLSDPDGSLSDIGIYGGAGAALWDRDSDGWYDWWLPGDYDPATSPGMDCDDDDPDVYWGVGC